MRHDFLDFLTSKGLLDHSIQERIKIENEESKIGVVALVSRLSTVSDTRLAREVAEFTELPRFNYNRFDVDKVATELVSGIVSVRLGILPYRFGENGDLYAVCCDPELVEGIVHDLKKVIAGAVILEVGPIRAVRELAAFVHYGRGISSDFERIVATEDVDSTEEKKGSAKGEEDSGFTRSPSFHASSPSKTLIEEVSNISKKKNGPPPPPQSNEFYAYPSRRSAPELRGIDTSKVISTTPSGVDTLPPIPDDPVDVIIDQQLAHLAELHEESLASEWEDEDTVVRQRNSRDESLRDFFLQQQNPKPRVQKELERKRRNFIALDTAPIPVFDQAAEDGLVDPISEGELDLDISDATCAPLGYDHRESATSRSAYGDRPFGPGSPDSKTPYSHSSSESSVVLRLFQHEARIEQLEKDLEKIAETLDSIVFLVEAAGVDLSELKKSRNKDKS